MSLTVEYIASYAKSVDVFVTSVIHKVIFSFVDAGKSLAVTLVIVVVDVLNKSRTVESICRCFFGKPVSVT